MKVKLKKTLLLVENDKFEALSRKKKLEQWGYNVLSVNTGKQAIALSKANKEIDLILMDIRIKGEMDGLVKCGQALFPLSPEPIQL